MVEIEPWSEERLDELEKGMEAAPSFHCALSALRYLRNGLDNQRMRSAVLEKQRDMAQEAKRSVEQSMARLRRDETEATQLLNEVRNLLVKENWWD